jgi:hypothetical protein
VDLTVDVFDHDQLYVAFSRVKRRSGLKVLTNKDKRNRMRNVVWRQILMDKNDRPIDEPGIKEADSMNEGLPDYDIEGFYLSDEVRR